MTVDLLLEVEGDDLPEARLKEKETLYMTAMTRKPKIREVIEPTYKKHRTWISHDRERTKLRLSHGRKLMT